MLPEASNESTSDSDSDSDEASAKVLVQTKAKKVDSSMLDSVTLSFASSSFHQTHLKTRMTQAQSQVG